MNGFGRLFRVGILGESHGEEVGVVVDGCPAGLPLAPGDFARELARRRPGAAGTTARVERDDLRLRSGVFRGRTTGAPILIELANRDVDSTAYEAVRHRPRPGHADLTARAKSGGFNDYRGAGHHSGRLTAALVAAGVVARKLMPQVVIAAAVTEVGGSADVAQAVAEASERHEPLGGIVECTVTGLPLGLGEPFFDSVESLLAHAAFSIPAVKAIEFGAGFAFGRARGDGLRDEIVDAGGRTRRNHAGGADGGLTNGNPLVFRVAVKPPASVGRIHTVDLRSGRQVRLAPGGRHDVCIALRVPPVLEAVAAIVLADLMMIEQRIGRVADEAPRAAKRAIR